MLPKYLSRATHIEPQKEQLSQGTLIFLGGGGPEASSQCAVLLEGRSQMQTTYISGATAFGMQRKEQYLNRRFFQRGRHLSSWQNFSYRQVCNVLSTRQTETHIMQVLVRDNQLYNQIICTILPPLKREEITFHMEHLNHIGNLLTW